MDPFILYLRGKGFSGTTLAEALAFLATLPAAEQAEACSIAGRPIALSCPLAAASGGVTVDRQARVISNVAVMSIGEAMGHGFELDDTSLQTLVAAFEANKERVKSRLSHPELSIFAARDGAEVTVGRPRNLRIDGQVVRGDIHLGAYAAKSPAGDLLEYLLAIAEEDPSIIGISIVGEFDFERRFQADGRELAPVGRVRFLHAVDFVGDPAANRNGLLSSHAHTHAWEGVIMNEALRRFLESKGLKSGATIAEAWAFYHKLGGADRTAADALKTGDAPAAAATDNAGEDPDEEPAPVPAPAVEATAAGHATLSQADIDTRVQAALRADRQRRTALSSIAESVGLSDQWVHQQFEAGTTVERARELAIEHLRTSQPPVTGLSGHVSVGADRNLDTLGQAVEDAILLRAGMPIVETDESGNVLLDENRRPKLRKPHDRARQFRGLSLPEMVRSHLGAIGVQTAGMDRLTIVRLSMSRHELSRYVPGVLLAHSTSDFPSVLENVANKTLRRAYVEAQRHWPRFCRRATNPDFKTISRVQIGNFPNLRKVMEGAEIKQVTIGESKETYFLSVYAEIFGISWQALVNDDLQAFTRLPESMGMAAGRKEDILAFGVLNSNPTMADGVALFHADHGNLAGAGAAPSVATLNDGAEAMALQEGLATDADEPIYLDLEPDFLLAPRALQGTVRELLTSQVKPGANEGHTRNIWQGELDPIIAARLDANSSTAWYMAANPNTQPIDTIEVCFLEGNEQPMVTQDDGFNVLERRYRVVHAVEAAAIDYRGLYKNPG